MASIFVAFVYEGTSLPTTPRLSGGGGANTIPRWRDSGSFGCRRDENIWISVGSWHCCSALNVDCKESTTCQSYDKSAWMWTYCKCSVRLADLIRTTNAMVVLFSLAEFSLSRVVNRRDFWNCWRFVDQAILIADLSTLSIMTWHQGKSYNSWEV